MERKIGEIFEYNGEWYQCVKGDCTKCDFFIKRGCVSPLNTVCGKRIRKDKQNVIFKKLEKVGEPFTSVGKLYQYYKVFDIDTVYGDVFWCVHNYKAKTLTIEIKQNKEDMEDKNNAKHSNSEKIGKNLKEFDLEAAKSGKPVCTRDGRNVRIICFDKKKDVYPLIVLVSDKDGYEIINQYKANGAHPTIPDNDLMMLPEKKEGWINVYRDCDGANITKDDNIYSSKEAAIASAQIIDGNSYVATTKINWEE